MERLLDLTRRIRARKEKRGGKGPEIIWQKVLFNYNDSPEELAEYQHTALDCGVDTLRICYTYTSEHTASDPDKLERIFPNIEILNNRDRSQIPEELLENAARHDCEPGDIFSVISRLYHWLDCGMSSREEYDEFSSLSLDDWKLYEPLSDLPEFSRFITMLSEHFDALSHCYEKRGNEKDAYRFSQVAYKVSKMAEAVVR
ncbi:hypothetical protein [Salidesulfovibrio onnuriiensis]|uniref:hypothetical protein n=1 Tax=Salidesulfovibrio onnuriiensis TaxID=2583823 RepID=UPI0011CBACC8|nr:hypothetical protein [Salidesulfovibrio onnuriiensis]